MPTDDPKRLPPGGVPGVHVRRAQDAMEYAEPLRGTIITPKTFQPSNRVKPHINEMLGDAYHVLRDELVRIRKITEVGQALSAGDSIRLSKYVDALVKLAKEERDQEARNDPAELTDEKLLETLKEAEKVLTLGKPK